MLKNLLNEASREVLAQDPKNLERLAKVAGKVIAFDIKKLEQTIYFLPTADAIHIDWQAPEQVDVRIKAKPSSLIKIARSGIEEAELAPGELEIEGDAIVGQRFARLLAELNIDWEDLLAQRIGDMPAVLLSRAFTAAREWAEDTQNTMRQNTGEFLVEEVRLAASRSAVDRYLNDVDQLRNDVARLAAKVNHLKQLNSND